MSQAAAAQASNQPLVAVEGLRVAFGQGQALVQAVDGVSFALAPGETLALVGESGSGKSTTALALARLLSDTAQVEARRIVFAGRDMTDASPKAWRRLLGRSIGMVFQEPRAALNPVMRIGKQVAEPIAIHLGLSSRMARVRALNLLAEVGLDQPQQIYHSYPHELSGGMCQRAAIAMALACGPSLLIADEPTSALDVTIQAQLLKLLRRLQRSRQMAILLITHDLTLLRHVADRTAVLYAGRIVEEGATSELIKAPRHPYTLGLQRAVEVQRQQGRHLYTIPAAATFEPQTQGCAFAPRCEASEELCLHSAPELDAGVACYRPRDSQGR